MNEDKQINRLELIERLLIGLCLKQGMTQEEMLKLINGCRAV